MSTNPLLPPTHLDAEKILRASRSNFAPAFRLLSSTARKDITLLYALCRVIDDAADNEEHAPALRREALEAWRAGFLHPEGNGLPDNLRELLQRRSLPLAPFLELLEGATTDLALTVRMATRADLDRYCYRVAGTVGLLCLPIFEADTSRCTPYAETLGRALQYTNILRDTASDLRRGRIYYPLDELAEAGLTPENFASKNERRQFYLQQFSQQAEHLFAEAARLLPPQDQQALRTARLMAALYARLLDTMRRDGLGVMEQRYRLTTAEKLRVLTTEFASNILTS